MAPISATFEFDELSIAVHGRFDSGVMISGCAELEGDDEGFLVTELYLEDGTCLSDVTELETPFEAELFRRIALIIQNDRTRVGRYAAAEWADAVALHKEVA
ncbi:hypothetical protein [Agrobacterium sp. NPDC090273]|uniref:hypothetical protein n=1 Tax=Agrobacterium sp. NPDC090273 TaxID=3363919 RepID=UPI003839FC99